MYIVYHRSTKLKYIGVRYAKGCNPKDLWITYFTSSKLIKKLIDEFGKETFKVRILHTFPNQPKLAILKEAEYFPLIKKRNNFLNICYSSGIQDLRTASKAGKVGGAIVKNKKIGIFRNEEERLLWASMGGKVGAKIQIENKIGIHSQTVEERKMYASMGGKVGGFTNSDLQRELGKRGGLKNKGFRWYNNGTKSFKYTTKQQLEKPFDEFIKENNFKKGRINVSKNKIN